MCSRARADACALHPEGRFFRALAEPASDNDFMIEMRFWSDDLGDLAVPASESIWGAQ